LNIEVTIGNVKFKNPVTVASGTFGHAEKYYDLEEVKRLGAITPKTVTCFAQEGNPLAQVFELLVFTSYASYYSALLEGIDPTAIPVVDFFKAQLKK
jgi:dihydroorotate dehydrogenase